MILMVGHMNKQLLAGSSMVLALSLMGCEAIKTNHFEASKSHNIVKVKQPPKEPLTKIKQEYIERFGIRDLKRLEEADESKLSQELNSLSKVVSLRYKNMNPADIYKFEFSEFTYVNRPYHHPMRAMDVTIAKGDTIVSTAKSEDFINNGISTPVRFTLSENLYLYINGSLVDKIYKGGEFIAYSQMTPNKRISSRVNVLEE